MSLLMLLLYLTFQLLLVLRIDGATPTLAWSLVAAPLYCTEAIYAVQALLRCRPSAFEAERAQGPPVSFILGDTECYTLGPVDGSRG